MVISNSARSWLLLVPLIPSIMVSIFDLYHFLSSRATRRALQNHVIILFLSFGLIETLTDIVWHIHFYRTDTALSSTHAFCLIWVYVSAAMYISMHFLMTWASIERHILIFHPDWFATKIKRFFFHYLPLAICVLYPKIFYFFIFFIRPCESEFNYKIRLCNLYTCVVTIRWISLWDSIGHYIIPAFATVIFSVALLIRVLYRRYVVRRRIEWRNYKKLAAQLLPITSLYIVLQVPPIIFYAAYSGGLPRTVASSYYSDTLYFTYWIVLLMPFASALSLPELGTKCRNIVLFWQRRNIVVPQMLPMVPLKIHRIPAIIPAIH